MWSKPNHNLILHHASQKCVAQISVTLPRRRIRRKKVQLTVSNKWSWTKHPSKLQFINTQAWMNESAKLELCRKTSVSTIFSAARRNASSKDWSVYFVKNTLHNDLCACKSMCVSICRSSLSGAIYASSALRRSGTARYTKKSAKSII